MHRQWILNLGTTQGKGIEGDNLEGVKFDDFHSYADFGLILNYVSISPPEPKTHYAEIAGADGSIDLTEALTGDVKYKNRTLEFSFTYKGNHSNQLSEYTKIGKYIHGRNMKIIIDSDSNYYYQGRVEISKCEHQPGICIFDISCNVEPYKYDFGDDWLWDPFDFEEGFINELRNLNVNGTLDVLVIGHRKRYIPWITCSAAMSVTYNGITYSLKAGKNKIFDIAISEGEQRFLFMGYGVVSIENKGGEL